MTIFWIYGVALLASTMAAFVMANLRSPFGDACAASPAGRAAEAETLVREIAEVEAGNVPDILQSRARAMVRTWDATQDERVGRRTGG